MEIDDLISLLELLTKVPGFVKKILDDGFETEFGIIKKDCMGSCVKIELFNNIVLSTDIIGHVDNIDSLFTNIRSTVEEFSIFLIKNKIKQCYEAISNADIKEENNI